MSQDTWTAVDDYFEAELMPADPVLDAAVAAAQAAGLPAIAVAPNQGQAAQPARPDPRRQAHPRGRHAGRLLHHLAGPRAARRTASLLTCEYEQKHADVALANLASAGLADKVEVRVGPALDTLDGADRGRRGPVRPGVPRRRQAEQPELLRAGDAADPAGQRHHLRQRRARRRSGRRRPAPTSGCSARAGSPRRWGPSRGSRRRRSRRWAARGTTASRSPSSRAEP